MVAMATLAPGCLRHCICIMYSYSYKLNTEYSLHFKMEDFLAQKVYFKIQDFLEFQDTILLFLANF